MLCITRPEAEARCGCAAFEALLFSVKQIIMLLLLRNLNKLLSAERQAGTKLCVDSRLTCKTQPDGGWGGVLRLVLLVEWSPATEGKIRYFVWILAFCCEY